MTKLSLNIKNKTGFYTPYTLDASVIIANSALTKDIKLKATMIYSTQISMKIATADPSTLLVPCSLNKHTLWDQGAMKMSKLGHICEKSI